MNHKFFAGVLAMFSVAFIKLPYEAGQRFVAVQAYESPPTHVGHDLYAIDFSQDGCDAYGKLAVAATAGTVMLAQEAGYNGGYGTQVLVANASRIIARYAHMIPGSIPTGVANGDAVQQGEPLGEIGDTGLVAGNACPIHPGTHIHFAMDTEASDGSFTPFLPEPISNYVGITAGTWYLSDNALAIATPSGAAAIASRAAQAVFGEGVVLGAATSSSHSQSSTQGSTAQTLPSPPAPVYVAPLPAPTGGVSASPPPVVLPPSQVSSDAISTPTTTPTMVVVTATTTSPVASSVPPLAVTDVSFNSTTLAVDLAWQVPTDTTAANSSTPTSTMYEIFASTSSSTSSTFVATTTASNFSYPLAPGDFGSSLQFTVSGDSTIATAAIAPAIAVPNWWTVIQPIADTNSNGSWYDDNWYDLGTGFYGTIRALTLQGFIDSSYYSASHLYLDEYLDANYSQLNQTYTISDGAPFTDGVRRVTIGNLDIPLQPNKYYRLRTYQDFQNRSVILAGTSATGTAMWDGYIYGVGIVRYTYQFYPYLAAAMIPNYPPLLPPDPPTTATVTFDSSNLLINISWPGANDPDTTSSLLTYQVNIATSSGAPVFTDAAWQSVGKALSTSTPVVFGNSYAIGIRTVDDFGATSTPLVMPWSFPVGYAPVPEQSDHSVIVGSDGGAQKITFVTTTTVSGIVLWTNGEFGGWCCSDSAISIHPDASGTTSDAPGQAAIAESNTVRVGPYQGAGEQIYAFTPPQTLSPGTYWFMVDNPTGLNDIQIFGSPGDSYAGGAWSTAPSKDAYFRIAE